MKKWMSLVLAMTLLVSCMLPLAAAENAGIQDGTYSYTTNGHNGEVTVTLTIKNGQIVDAQQESIETQGIGTVAWTVVHDTLINEQSINVDAVTGATVSRAVYTYAAQKCLEQAGANVNEWKKAKEAHTPETVTMDTDVLVVGSGAAGLTAALTAAENGLHVVIAEKLTVLGGASIRCDGLYYAANSYVERDMGITEDSGEAMYQDAMDLFTSDLVDPEIVQIWAENSQGGFEFMTEHGVQWADFTFPYRAIHAPRVASAIGGGAGMISALIEKAQQNENITIINNLCVNELLQNEQNAIIGARAAATNGDTYTFNTENVLLATGGFAADKTMMTEHSEPLLAGASRTNPNVGDGYKMAEAAGARMQDSPDSITMFVDNESGKAMIGAVNPELFIVSPTGERFTNGSKTANDLAHDALALGYSTIVAIFDQNEFDALKDTFEPMLAKGHVAVADTPAELAAQLGMDADTLTATITRYNELCDKGVDEDFGRAPEMMTKLDSKLYAITLEPNTYESFSGPQINGHAQVIGLDGNPIEGLYAAGGITMWQVTDYHYVGCGSAINNAVVFGMQAAEHILSK